MVDGYDDPRLNNIGHSQENLSRLWDLIKAAKCPDGVMDGLNPTYFGVRLDIDSYAADYAHKISLRNQANGYTRKSSVETDLESVIARLKGARVSSHHMSCSAERLTGFDSALSIYFRGSDGDLYAIGIPGVSYKR